MTYFLATVIVPSLVSFSCCPSHIQQVTDIKFLAISWTHCAVLGTHASLYLGNVYFTSCITKHEACTRCSIGVLNEWIPKLNSNIISSDAHDGIRTPFSVLSEFLECAFSAVVHNQAGFCLPGPFDIVVGRYTGGMLLAFTGWRSGKLLNLSHYTG